MQSSDCITALDDALRRAAVAASFGSLVGWQGAPAAATYGATKAFIQSFAEGVGNEFRASKVDVLSCAPGPVGSGFAARAHMTMGASDTPDQVHPLR